VEEAELELAERPGHRLIAHSFQNALGQGVPIVVAVIAVPLVLKLFGVEKLGLLTLVWSVIGYASLFDFGVGRALTQLVAERRHTADAHELVTLVWSALVALTVIGLGFGLTGFLLTPWVTHAALTISPNLQDDATTAFRLLCVGIPVVVITTGVRGVLEAYERFDLVNMVRVPMGISMFVGPLIVAPFSRSLTSAVIAVWLGRAAALVAQAIMMRRVLPAVRSRAKFSREILRPVARYGAWMTVSNVLSPLMTQADRFVIGALLSTSVVAYYTAPYEMLTRVMAAVALAVATSLFPAFARWRDHEHARALFVRGVRLTMLVFVPIMLIIILFAHSILSLWLGAEFAARSTVVLRILGIGVLFNGLAQIPFAHIQAVGRADLTAKIHMVEAPGYLALAIYMIRGYGIEGAAVAWSARMFVDALLLFAVSQRQMAKHAAIIPAEVVEA
jgi:O-antigen/teichoic acid export membrane protein